MPHFMIALIPYNNLLNLSWVMKCLFLRKMEPLKGIDIHSGEATLSKLFCLSFKKEPTLKKKNLLLCEPFFLLFFFRVDPISDGA